MQAAPRILPDDKQLVQQIGGGGEQRAPGDVQRLPPPRVRAQGRHDAAVVLQRVRDHVAIKRELLVVAIAEAEGKEALVAAEVERARAAPRQAHAPVHHPRAPRSALRRRSASPLGASWALLGGLGHGFLAERIREGHHFPSIRVRPLPQDQHQHRVPVLLLLTAADADVAGRA
ncbi:hypothetical protein C0J45_15941 [Silurus meridionalis]|nr:hypothetical protein C0J45_15941 [Silurus meridionalis]